MSPFQKQKIEALLKEMEQLLPATWGPTEDHVQANLRGLVTTKIADLRAVLPKAREKKTEDKKD